MTLSGIAATAPLNDLPTSYLSYLSQLQVSLNTAVRLPSLNMLFFFYNSTSQNSFKIPYCLLNYL